jgi:hypothetical protein
MVYGENTKGYDRALSVLWWALMIAPKPYSGRQLLAKIRIFAQELIRRRRDLIPF